MNTLISREFAVAVIGMNSIAAIGCGLTKALVQPKESKTKGACISAVSLAALIASSHLLRGKGAAAISALASTFFTGVGLGFAPAPSCLEGRTWSLAGAGMAGIATCVAIQTLKR